MACVRDKQVCLLVTSMSHPSRVLEPESESANVTASTEIKRLTFTAGIEGAAMPALRTQDGLGRVLTKSCE